MARCGECNKFVSYSDDEEPEASLEVTTGLFAPDDEGITLEVTGDVRIFKACANCDTELREASFEVEESYEASVAHKDHDLDVQTEVEAIEYTEGKGRGMKTFYGYSLSCKVVCLNCEVDGEPTVLASGSAKDYIPAGEMDEL